MSRLATIDDLLNGDPDEVARLLARSAKLSDLLEEFIQEDDRGESGRHWGIHASELQCLRKAVYSVLDTKRVGNKIHNNWKKRFKVGHAVHEMFQRDFAALAEKWRARPGWRITFEAEVPIRPDLQEVAGDWGIFSHCDGLFVVRDEEDRPLLRVALEMKTKSPAEYEKMKAPEPGHIEQAHVYMKCLDVPVTWFLYYNKGNQNYTPSRNPTFFVKYDPRVWEKIEGKMAAVHQHAARGALPPREEGVHCQFCAFAWTCKPKQVKQANGVHVPNNKWLRMVNR